MFINYIQKWRAENLPKISTHKNTNKASPIIYYRMSRLTVKIVAKCITCTILVKLKKNLWDSLKCANLWQWNVHKEAAPYFSFIYIVQLYEEDCESSNMLGFRAVALPRTDQIVYYHDLVLLLKKRCMTTYSDLTLFSRLATLWTLPTVGQVLVDRTLMLDVRTVFP